jgi:hypothetical protein
LAVGYWRLAIGGWLLAVGCWMLFFLVIREIRTIIFFTKIDFFRRIGEFICIIQKKAVILQRDKVKGRKLKVKGRNSKS